MKFEEALVKKNITVQDLPLSQQAKIKELLLSSQRTDELELDVDEESKEAFDSIKSQIETVDKEVVLFIENFDLELAKKKREQMVNMRNSKKEKVQNTPAEKPKFVQIEASSSLIDGGIINAIETTTANTASLTIGTPTIPEPPIQTVPYLYVDPIKATPPPPIVQNEQKIGKHIEELKNEVLINTELLIEEAPKQIEVASEVLEPVVEEEFARKGEKMPKKINLPLIVLGVGALLLTWGAVNFFKGKK